LATHLTWTGRDRVAYDRYGFRDDGDGRDGFGSDGDGWGWVSVSVPMQTSTTNRCKTKPANLTKQKPGSGCLLRHPARKWIVLILLLQLLEPVPGHVQPV